MSDHQVPSEELEALYIETNSFRLASHLYWALWGLIQVRVIIFAFLNNEKQQFYRATVPCR